MQRSRNVAIELSGASAIYRATGLLSRCVLLHCLDTPRAFSVDWRAVKSHLPVGRNLRRHRHVWVELLLRRSRDGETCRTT